MYLASSLLIGRDEEMLLGAALGPSRRLAQLSSACNLLKLENQVDRRLHLRLTGASFQWDNRRRHDGACCLRVGGEPCAQCWHSPGSSRPAEKIAVVRSPLALIRGLRWMLPGAPAPATDALFTQGRCRWPALACCCHLTLVKL